VKRTRTHGFTLVEAMVVVGIIGVTAALAGFAMSGANQRARLGNIMHQTTALISVAQMRAVTHSVPQYLVVWQNANQDPKVNASGGVLLLHRPELPLDGNPYRAWKDVDPVMLATDELANKPDYFFPAKLTLDVFPQPEVEIIENHFLPLSEGVSFKGLSQTMIPGKPFLTTSFPAPFSAIEIKGAGSMGLLEACSFCFNVPGGIMGVIRFDPDGSVAFEEMGTTNLFGGSLAFAIQRAGEQPSTMVLAISRPAGAYRIYK
jgi:prepilin-type N-terminal cleavage/methylation domain-containing protein